MGRVKGDKYNRKYCKQLTRGLCKDGMSEEEVCQLWEINPKTFRAWKEQYPEFKEAADIAKRDRISWWLKLNRDVASGVKKGNAGVLCFAMKNIEGISWQDKVEVANVGVEPIKQINISILPPPDTKKLEHGSILEHDDV